MTRLPSSGYSQPLKCLVCYYKLGNIQFICNEQNDEAKV